MDFPAVHGLMAKVRELEQIARQARSGEPTAEDYLRAVNADPAAEWYRDLLREKSEELEQLQLQSDELLRAFRAWHDAHLASGTVTEADVHLIEALRGKGLLN